MQDVPSDSAPKQDSPQRAPNKLKGWLLASVVLNMALAGIVIGGGVTRMMSHEDGHGRRPPPMAVRDIGFAFMRALPDERRSELFQQARAKLKNVRPLFEESMRARKDAFTLLEKDVLTAQELKAAFARAQKADSAAQEQAGGAFAEIVAALPAQERRAAVAKMRERWAAREAQRAGPDFGKGD